jgi:protein-S-isoprenylcysteine O-methyltransferase Ste14
MALTNEFETQGNWLFKRRSFLPIGILITAVLAIFRKAAYPHEFPLYQPNFDAYYVYTALFVGLFGLLIRAYTVGYSPRNTSGRNTSEGQVAESLNTNGIYSLVRHPLYVGNYLMWIGPALMTANFWYITAISCLYWIYYERIMYAEEAFLMKKFETEFSSWAGKTPAFFPKFHGYIKSPFSFSWKKVLKKEKNGFLALSFILFLFDNLRGIVQGHVHPNPVISFLFVLSIVSYLFLKYLKYHTTVLDEDDR